LCILVYEMENWSLPKIKKMVGPPIFSHRHSQEFLEKYGSIMPPKGFGPYVEDNRWAADKTRDFSTVQELLQDLLKKKQDELQAFGIPKYIAEEFRRAKLLEDKKFFLLVKKDKALSAALREVYFEKMGL
jgi:tRNA nucleotidyltransferase (CCA-adding enzyme)